MEISAESHSYAANFAHRIGGGGPAAPKPRPSGAALILDYGPRDTIPTSTLRGIRAHRLVSPLSRPGQVDLSADVDFAALAAAALAASPAVEVHGPVEQGAWLERMGIRERGDMICKGGAGSAGTAGPAGPEGTAGTAEPAGPQQQQQDEQRTRRIQQAISRLVERQGGGMGRIYKVLAMVPEAGGRRAPVGFGGDVA